MAFPRLNNISYLLLIPSIVLFLFAGGIENGVGTGWTLNMEYSDEIMMIGGIKLFSMREYPQKNEIRYSWLSKLNLQKLYVKTLMTGGQYAWVAKRNFVIHQRLNKEYLEKNEKEWFERWLVGITDGEGTFGFYKQNGKWILVYKIALSRYNLRCLYYIKTNLGIGTITKDNTKAQILITDRTKIENVIFPIFDKYPLLTSKYFNYIKLKKAFNITTDPNLDKIEKDRLLLELKEKTLPEDYRSPVWDNIIVTHPNVFTIVSKPWLAGFIEGEGSFYLVKKAEDRIVHGFAISQKLDKILLEAIQKILHISTKVKYKEKHNYFLLDTTNSRTIENLIAYFKDNFVGMKSVEYKIWARTYTKHKGNYNKLLYVQSKIRMMKSILLDIQDIEKSKGLFDNSTIKKKKSKP